MQGIIPQAAMVIVADRLVAAGHDDANWPDDYDDCPVCGGLSINIRTGLCENGCDLTADPVDVELAYALACTDPDLWAHNLPGESLTERAARRDAAVDILAELLAEAEQAVTA